MRVGSGGGFLSTEGVEKRKNNTWLRSRLHGRAAFVHDRYLKLPEDEIDVPSVRQMYFLNCLHFMYFDLIIGLIDCPKSCFRGKEIRTCCGFPHASTARGTVSLFKAIFA